MRGGKAILISVILVGFLAVRDVVADEPKPEISGDSISSHDAAYRLADPIPHLYTLALSQTYARGITAQDTGHKFITTLSSTMPFTIGEQSSYFVHPVIPHAWKNGSEYGNVEGFGAPRIETYFSATGASRDEFKMGPLLYLPAPGGSAVDTTQTGIGASAVGIVRPGNWALGLYGYQSFALGGSDAGGTVNFTYAQPFISYVTAHAWTYTLKLESLTNWQSSGVSNPLYAVAGKTVTIFTMPISFSVGAHYYLSSSTYDYSSGFGGDVSMSFVLGKE
jgi:hypothetical protein